MPMLTEGMTSSSSVEWGTPDSLFDPYNELYAFTLDGAASHVNAKVARYCTAEGTFTRLPTGAPSVRLDGADLVTRGPWGAALQISDLDGLNFSWEGERVWLNPPWGEAENPCRTNCKKDGCTKRGWHTPIYLPGTEDFLRKVRDEFLRHRALVACALPARTDVGWFHDFVLPYARIQWLRGRVHYIDPEGPARIAEGLKPREGPPVGTMIAVYR